MNESDTNKLGKTSLIGLVIGSMIGGGAFNIISDMGGQAGGLAIMIGWIITNRNDFTRICLPKSH